MEGTHLRKPYGGISESAGNRAERGSYKNLFRRDHGLAGIEAYQKPITDNPTEDYKRYLGKHAGTVNYHFWDGRILSILFKPNGRAIEKRWWRHQPNEPAACFGSWDRVDFSQGSDPKFEHHADPRVRKHVRQ